ncbi:hypothetical protein NC653_028808 [Populus alba x Populus x berolinensis]|uniref:Uncharacterized protein n=1 Tax=Populus alba x Populus x berolinensis TaxID=444605 RepID=A0AAD6M0N6_9ROSI|nr:hypothetical protein NC653_028808 [Populus alba x Populus x berolinensis]
MSLDFNMHAGHARESFGSYEDTLSSVADNYHSLLRLFEADLAHGLGTKFISSQVTKTWMWKAVFISFYLFRGRSKMTVPSS